MANAGTASLDLVMGSYHFDREYDYNEVNPGVIVKYYPQDNGFYFYGGGYYNSFSRTSLSGGIGREYRINEYLTMGWSAGLVSGYEVDYINSPVLPQIAGTLRIMDRLNIMAIPAGKDSVIGFSLTVGEW
jgi:hypothetical protein